MMGHAQILLGIYNPIDYAINLRALDAQPNMPRWLIGWHQIPDCWACSRVTYLVMRATAP